MSETVSRSAEPATRPLTRRELRAMSGETTTGWAHDDADDAPLVWNLDDGGSEAPYTPAAWDLAEEETEPRPLTRRELRAHREAEEAARATAVGTGPVAVDVPTPMRAPSIEGVAPRPSDAMPRPSDEAAVATSPRLDLAREYAVAGPRDAELLAEASAPDRAMPRLAAGFRTSRQTEVPAAAVGAAEMTAPADDGPEPTGEPAGPPATDGYGMPAVLMNAPVLPALAPIEDEVEEISEPLRWESDRETVHEPVLLEVDDDRAVEAVAGLTPEPEMAPEDTLVAWLPPEPEPEPVPTPEPESMASSAFAIHLPPASIPTPRTARSAPRIATTPRPAPRPLDGRSRAVIADSEQPSDWGPEITSRPVAPASVRSDPLQVSSSPWQAVYGAWLGLAAVLMWALGPFALALGLWSFGLAKHEGGGLARPLVALLGGAVGTLLGALFLLLGP